MCSSVAIAFCGIIQINGEDSTCPDGVVATPHVFVTNSIDDQSCLKEIAAIDEGSSGALLLTASTKSAKP